MTLLRCPECGAQVSSAAAACPHCGYPLAKSGPVATRPARPIGPIKYWYIASLVTGVAIAAYIYLVRFDTFSETTLVQLTPLWVFFIVLGYYGLVAERMLATDKQSGGEMAAEGVFELIKAASPGPVGKLFAAIVHLPFVLFKSRRSWVVAAGGAAVWALALWFFFAVIFPTL